MKTDVILSGIIFILTIMNILAFRFIKIYTLSAFYFSIMIMCAAAFIVGTYLGELFFAALWAIALILFIFMGAKDNFALDEFDDEFDLEE